MSNNTNRLSGIIKPGHGMFREYLLKHGEERGIAYTLEEFDDELRTYSLRKNDADKVMSFLEKLSDSFKTNSFLAKSSEGVRVCNNKAPYLVFSPGKDAKFHDVSATLSLYFLCMSPYTVTNNIQLKSDNLNVDFAKYEGTDEFLAWNKVIKNINRRVDYNTGERFEMSQVKDPLALEGVESAPMEVVYFSAYTSDRASDLNNIATRAFHLAEFVFEAYTATKNLPEFYEARIDDLAKRLTQSSTS